MPNLAIPLAPSTHIEARRSQSSILSSFASLWIAASVILFAAPLTASETHTLPSLNLVLVSIPAGSFTMGSPSHEAGRSDDEGPQTKVVLTRSFWLGRTEVTHAQWRTVMGTDLHEQARRLLADETVYTIAGKAKTLAAWLNYSKNLDPAEIVDNTDDDAPMYLVSWDEAVAFCRRLTEEESAAHRLPAGYEYRLPSEAEWEYACRAGTTDATFAGDLVIKGKHDAPVLDTIAWYGGNSAVGYRGKGADVSKVPEMQYPGGTAAQRGVATKKPNAWGLYDMIGNVDEWCGDWYSDRLPGGEITDPSGPAFGTQRLRRGGTWHQAAQYCRSASRIADPPGWRARNLGFRVALAPIR